MLLKFLIAATVSLCPFLCYSQSCDYEQYITTLEDKGYTISKTVKSSVEQGETAYYWKTFEAGLDYVIVASSDDKDVSDVDVYLYKSDGTTLRLQDTNDDDIAIITFHNYTTSYMKVVVKNYKSSTPTFSSTIRFIIAFK